MFHFIPKPVERVLTRQERIIEQRQFNTDMRLWGYYALFLLAVFSACWIGSLFASMGDVTDTLQEKICSKKPNSVLCTDKSILERMEKITKAHDVPIELVVWIAFAESSLHTNYNKPICKSYNNLWWLKGYKRDNGKLDWYDNKNGHDSNGCWLYKFESIEQGTEAISNTLSMGYKGCKYDTRCISYNYVGKPDVAEESWIARVWEFYTQQKQ